VFLLAVSCKTLDGPEIGLQMTLKTVMFPAGSIRCQRGDYILQHTADDSIRVYAVQDLVKLSRLVPFGEDALVDEQAILDSEQPAFKDDIYLLLTAYERDFGSLEEAAHAVRAGDVGPAMEAVCLNINRFPVSSNQCMSVRS
jgi:hypothetical protein